MIKELTIAECYQVIRNNYIGYLGYYTGNYPMVVPITYYLDDENDNLISYSLKGLKMVAMRMNKPITILISEITSVNQWKSVLVRGVYEELESATAKEQLHLFTEGVKEIINREKEIDVHFISDFSRQIHGQGHPIVYRIKMTEITGKRRN